jgi:hypothetical protein
LTVSKRDFVAIAAVIASIANTASRIDAARDMVAYLRTRNPRFNRARFLAACGVEE